MLQVYCIRKEKEVISVKVEIKVLPETKEPYAVIYTSEITPKIRQTATLLETESSDVIPVTENERIIALRPDEIYMVRVENERTVVYTKAKNTTAESVFTNWKQSLQMDSCEFQKVHLQICISLITLNQP